MLAAATLAAQQQSSTATTTRAKGSASAPITVYEMSDFQCPYCRRFALETFPAIEKEYIAPGKVRWVFVNFPLTSIHANAVAAASTAVCAARQGAFWPMHDLIFEYQETWAPLKEPGPFLVSLADSVGISKPKLVECVKSPSTEDEIRYEAVGAERAGATSTPTFYVEGGLMPGAHPLPVFRQVFDSILAAQATRPSQGK
ncbi:MAG TPA: thioredoxin domain-containing protein [Gemmatimonadales bacterium]|nr:thioredoxin domain-containing protein [Gemmatimonadales bacterium]